MTTLASQLEEQQKIIQFLQSKYERDTGRKIALPQTVGTLLGDDSLISEEDTKKEKEVMKESRTVVQFNEAIERLRLPRGEPPKKGEKKKSIPLTKEHMSLEKIDLSGFKGLRFSRAGMRELIEGIQILPCVRTLSLKKNGITDEFEKEILDIFSIPKIKCIDLSNNNLLKLGGIIGKKLRDECTHIQWLDLTQNDFYNDNAANSMIIQGLKKQASLVYVGLTVPTNLSDQLAKLIQPKKPAFNLNMRNTQLTKGATDYLNRTLQNHDFYLTGLSLKFCYLTLEQVIDLANSVRFNKSLVKLDLSNNGFKSFHVKYLLESIIDNTALMELNLSGNFLDDQFGYDLAHTLYNNSILFKVDISKNPIGPNGAQALIKSLLECNETLGSLGDLADNMYMGVRIREELRQILFLNTTSHDRKRAINKEIQESTKINYVNEKQVDNPQHLAEQQRKIKVPASEQMKYPLLKPVTFTNQLEDDYLSLGNQQQQRYNQQSMNQMNYGPAYNQQQNYAHTQHYGNQGFTNQQPQYRNLSYQPNHQVPAQYQSPQPQPQVQKQVSLERSHSDNPKQYSNQLQPELRDAMKQMFQNIQDDEQPKQIQLPTIEESKSVDQAKLSEVEINVFPVQSYIDEFAENATVIIDEGTFDSNFKGDKRQKQTVRLAEVIKNYPLAQYQFMICLEPLTNDGMLKLVSIFQLMRSISNQQYSREYEHDQLIQILSKYNPTSGQKLGNLIKKINSTKAFHQLLDEMTMPGFQEVLVDLVISQIPQEILNELDMMCCNLGSTFIKGKNFDSVPLEYYLSSIFKSYKYDIHYFDTNINVPLIYQGKDNCQTTYDTISFYKDLQRICLILTHQDMMRFGPFFVKQLQRIKQQSMHVEQNREQYQQPAYNNQNTMMGQQLQFTLVPPKPHSPNVQMQMEYEQQNQIPQYQMQQQQQQRERFEYQQPSQNLQIDPNRQERNQQRSISPQELTNIQFIKIQLNKIVETGLKQLDQKNHYQWLKENIQNQQINDAEINRLMNQIEALLKSNKQPVGIVDEEINFHKTHQNISPPSQPMMMPPLHRKNSREEGKSLRNTHQNVNQVNQVGVLERNKELAERVAYYSINQDEINFGTIKNLKCRYEGCQKKSKQFYKFSCCRTKNSFQCFDCIKTSYPYLGRGMQYCILCVNPIPNEDKQVFIKNKNQQSFIV